MSNILLIAGMNSKYQRENVEPAGFWVGLWHGLIMPIVFLVSLFNPGVGIYETNNRGNWYNFGFVLGASASFGGTSSSVSSGTPIT